MIDLAALALGPLDAFRGGQLSALSHRLPSKVPTAIYGMGVAHVCGLSALDAGFWLVVIAWILGEATGWSVALATACNRTPAGDMSWWEKLLGITLILKHPDYAMLVRGVIWALPVAVVSFLVPEARQAAAGIVIAVPLAPILGRNLFEDDCWKAQEWLRGWILGLVMVML